VRRPPCEGPGGSPSGCRAFHVLEDAGQGVARSPHNDTDVSFAHPLCFVLRAAVVIVHEPIVGLPRRLALYQGKPQLLSALGFSMERRLGERKKPLPRSGAKLIHVRSAPVAANLRDGHTLKTNARLSSKGYRGRWQRPVLRALPVAKTHRVKIFCVRPLNRSERAQFLSARLGNVCMRISTQAPASLSLPRA
jgi:hypothetical protein